MDLFAGIIGWGDVSYENASRLLDDYLPPEPEIVVDYHDVKIQPGMGNVISWMDKVHQDYTTDTRTNIISRASASVDNAVIIIVGTDYLDQEIQRCEELGVTVLDLTRALFPAMPSDGAEGHAETLPDSPAVSVSPEPFSPSQGLEAMPLTIEAVRKIVKEEVTKLMSEYHARQYIDGQPWQPAKEDEVPEESTPDLEDKTAESGGSETYYRDDAKETYRKKGRRKIKPGETEVELTAEEVTLLGDKVVS